ncbi:MAG: methyltransferase [Proteobacteria bacterium]|nr:methyltransferase [Pseudomonadota bacterium]
MNMLQEKNSHYLGIQKSFEKALHTYDDEAIIQLQISKFLIDYFAHLKPSPKKVLDLGCGTGLVTDHLCKTLSISSLHLNDFAQGSLTKACHRLKEVQPEGMFFNFDEEWLCRGLYDLIFSNMALQWSLDLPVVLKKCHSHLKQNAILAFSLPITGSFFELSPHQIIPFHTFDRICQILSNIGFYILKSDQILLNQEFRTHLHALKSIKRCGASYVHQNCKLKMIERTKLFLPSMLTYKIGIFIVIKSSKDESFYNRN